MEKLSRRNFLLTASAATLAAAAPALGAPLVASHRRQRVLVASNAPDGILAYDWDPANGELAPAGVAAPLANVNWITYSSGHEYLFAASDVSSFNGKPTGAVASFRVVRGELKPLSEQNSAGLGTCHVALDHSGRVLLAADYTGGSASSYLVTGGKIGPAVWSEHYTGHGPNADRQQSAHAHFAAISLDNRFAYINDLGGDCIHIYSLNATTAKLTPAGSYQARPGAGPRTLHFYGNWHTAYSVNELDSTVDVLKWNRINGSLTLVTRIELLPEGYQGPTRACDTIITRNGLFVYFANRDNDFLYSFHANPVTGELTPIGRTPCGGKTPRNFVLDPTENWMLVANQDSNLISVFRRNPVTGELATEGKSFPAAEPMRILF
ncbi:MAG: lactonase family protein [Terracidiphilus sp.]|jgi:6-phosphogluconolactonase